MGNYASDQKNARFYGLKLSRETDKDLIEILDNEANKQGLIKAALRLMAKQASTGSKPFRTAPGKYSCGICGSELPGKQRYCGNCGQPIKWTK